ncbi:Uncharacterised protein [Mycobacteroides abscessus]|nr:Uncharacterised protein [Mycobacteroides abscessus]
MSAPSPRPVMVNHFSAVSSSSTALATRVAAQKRARASSPSEHPAARSGQHKAVRREISLAKALPGTAGEDEIVPIAATARHQNAPSIEEHLELFPGRKARVCFGVPQGVNPLRNLACGAPEVPISIRAMFSPLGIPGNSPAQATSAGGIWKVPHACRRNLQYIPSAGEKMFSTGHCFPSTGSKPAGYLIEAIGSESMSGNSGSAVDAAAKQSGPSG